MIASQPASQQQQQSEDRSTVVCKSSIKIFILTVFVFFLISQNDEWKTRIAYQETFVTATTE